MIFEGSKVSAGEFNNFLLRITKWEPKEIKAIKRGEVSEVLRLVSEGLAAKAEPPLESKNS